MKKAPSEYLGTYAKAYITSPIDEQDFNKFLKQLMGFFSAIDINVDSEENIKSQFATRVLSNYQCVYDDRRIDLSLKKEGVTQVIFEFKKPSNKTEMLQSDSENIIRKSLLEAIWYFYNQPSEEATSQIKHIVITDTEQFFFFDANKFNNNNLKKLCLDFKEGKLNIDTTEKLYPLLKEVVEDNDIQFDYSCIDLRPYKNGIIHDNITPEQLIEIKTFYKLLSPQFLYREYNAKDSNELNEGFYKELLYILGLKEEVNTDTKSKVIIKLSNVPETISYQISHLFEITDTDKIIELMTVWLNRILFLKLFESQLISFNGNDENYAFLSYSKINNFGILQNLFFNILGKPVAERIGNKHEEIPYLNSSLFEQSQLELQGNSISFLQNVEPIELYSKSILKKSAKKTKRNILEYLLDFLDAYTFTSSNSTSSSKEIINSSVLGLIFEKLNGYKEGSYFTPGYVTEIMAKEAIDRLVLKKFNELFKDRAPSTTISELEKLLKYDRHIEERYNLYNKTIDSITVCDPACGSGHFLVSALNYLISLKSYLGLLPISNKIDIHNDALVIFQSDGISQFQYLRKHKDENQLYKIQKTIFNEKAKIIKNNLFGVDINPTSVEICRLRLWIELLKNAYYIKGSKDGSMALLPNIDINIKEGDSLINAIPLQLGKAPFIEDLYVSQIIPKYQATVIKYKNESNRRNKNSLKKEIADLKQSLIGDLFSPLHGYNHFEWMIEFPEVLNNNGEFQGFDVILVNPPYIDSESMTINLPKERAYYKRTFSTTKGNWDIYIPFLERCYQLLSTIGTCDCITPDKWLARPFGKALRKFIAPHICSITRFDRDVFESAIIDSIVSGFNKEEMANCLFNDYQKGTLEVKNIKPNKDLSSAPFDMFFSTNATLEKGLQFSDTVSTYASCQSACATSDAYILKDLLEDGNYSPSRDYKVINTGTIAKYKNLWGIRPMKYLKSTYNNPVVSRVLFSMEFGEKPYEFRTLSKKIIVKGLTKLDGALDLDGDIVPGKSTVLVLSEDTKLLKVLCACINSSFAFAYISQRYSSATYNGGITFNADIVGSIPIPPLTEENKNHIENLVDKILSSDSANANQIINDLDSYINKLYGWNPPSPSESTESVTEIEQLD